MSRLATFLIAVIDAIRALFSPASPPDHLAPPSTSPGQRPISPAVRAFVLNGHTEEIRASLVEQIEQYEAAGATLFTLQYPGGYYVIRDGQFVGSGRGE